MPTRAELAPVRELLARGLETALTLTRWASEFDFPPFERDYEFVAMAADEYPIENGRIRSSAGLDIAVQEYQEHFVEEHVAHSTALHSRMLERGPYLVGPAARFALNHELLSPLAREAAADAGLDADACRNPFRSILVRCVELVYACEEALRLIDRVGPVDRPAVPVEPRAAVGHGCSEAPRGLLYHRYELDEDGTILDARIVPPTSQNQAMIEHDLGSFVDVHQALPDDELQLRCEQAIRNYDPCISCSTHFLQLEVDRG